jgi:single-stranded DNA-binding protein
MLKAIATDAVVSKGYGDAPALRFSQNGDSVKFRFGKRVYDSKAPDNTRWINLMAKAFGPVCERIKKMQIKEGSYVNLSGRLDEDTWTDEKSNEKKSMTVIILDEIEYASGGGDKSAKNKQDKPQADNKAGEKQAANPENSENFAGYEPFGGGSFFD